jgi:hypothetical protein
MIRAFEGSRTRILVRVVHSSGWLRCLAWGIAGDRWDERTKILGRPFEASSWHQTLDDRGPEF